MVEKQISLDNKYNFYNYTVKGIAKDYEENLWNSLSGATCIILAKGHNEYHNKILTREGIEKMIKFMREGQDKKSQAIILDTCNAISDESRLTTIKNANATYIGLGKGALTNV